MTIAVDIDLHRIHAYCSDCGAICTSEPFLAPLYQHYDLHLGANKSIEAFPTILAEVASPVSTQRTNVNGKAISYQLMKWAIFNIATVADLDRDQEGNVLVAPSNVWTKNYTREVRHKLARATAKNRDLRDCEAMIFMFQLNPSAWIPFDNYIVSL